MVAETRKGSENVCGVGADNPYFSYFSGWPLIDLMQQACDYWVDAFQRSVLFVDVLRQRGNIHFEHIEKDAPHVLHFEFDVVIDGRDLTPPVNYMLLHILPPEGVITDPTKRPFIVFDPRAGHGPGIGGMKPDSEIGIAIRSGHPCYFVSFLPKPVPGQTIEDVNRTEALFIAEIIEMHPHADKPCLIGNCQAGWQIMMTSTLQPENVGVLILAGAPLSYWAGVHGKNPMRYVGGLTCGSWATSLANDLGNGLFDGAALVQNFENLNPANTLWKKDYKLYANVDTEKDRFLDFERWWGSPILLNGEEIQFIVDELFIGNRLSTAKVKTSSGVRMDIRNVKAPIVVFCSRADDITPPQQALGWILDLYSTEDEIVAYGQTIIYSLHDKIGHLGIFVSGSVANKEHEKFIHNIDMIEALPPGLYEAVFATKEDSTAHAELASGGYVMHFEKRGLEDIRALGCNDDDDDRRFATVARVSENWEGLYATFMSPLVRACVTDQSAEWRRRLHPMRFRFEMFSDRNPFVSWLAPLAAVVRQSRRPLTKENAFWALQEMVSREIVAALNSYRDTRDSFLEDVFLQVYGSPLLQAAVGIRNFRPYVRESAGRDIERENDISRRLRNLQAHVASGGLPEALVRGLIYVIRGGLGMDEREYTLLKRLRTESNAMPHTTQMEFKAMIRQQYMLLVLDEEGAIEAIPALLDRAEGSAHNAFAIIRNVIEAHGAPTGEEKRRLARLEKLFVPAHTGYRRRYTDAPPVIPADAEDADGPYI
ncbi:MAG: DUF3141 domain-containing protein [Alphaproteobacteria bacterium]|nr:DUF3141 domain-containing protein [Alphaproteobacteria bacterium]